MMRGRKTSFYLEHFFQALRHLGNGLNIVVVRPDLPTKMSKIDVTHHEFAVILEDRSDLLKLLVLLLAHILEETEGHYEIEALIIESNRFASNVEFPQVRSRFMNCNVDTMIGDVGIKQGSESGWSATDIEQSHSRLPANSLITRAHLRKRKLASAY